MKKMATWFVYGPQYNFGKSLKYTDLTIMHTMLMYYEKELLTIQIDNKVPNSSFEWIY